MLGIATVPSTALAEGSEPRSTVPTGVADHSGAIDRFDLSWRPITHPGQIDRFWWHPRPAIHTVQEDFFHLWMDSMYGPEWIRWMSDAVIEAHWRRFQIHWLLR